MSMPFQVLSEQAVAGGAPVARARMTANLGHAPQAQAGHCLDQDRFRDLEATANQATGATVTSALRRVVVHRRGFTLAQVGVIQ